MPSVVNNITKWRVFNDDEQIINFLTMEDTFKGLVIDKDQHDVEIKKGMIEPPKTTQENPIPRSMVKLEKFYDLHDKFKRVTNCKTHSWVMQYEVINLETSDKTQNINLEVQCSPNEKVAFTRLFKEYKDVFAWSYEDLKTFDTWIMQQNLSKMHPNLEPTVKVDLNKLLAARIIFTVHHTK